MRTALQFISNDSLKVKPGEEKREAERYGEKRGREGDGERGRGREERGESERGVAYSCRETLSLAAVVVLSTDQAAQGGCKHLTVD